jgi:protein-tyrosine kinase
MSDSDKDNKPKDLISKFADKLNLQIGKKKQETKIVDDQSLLEKATEKLGLNLKSKKVASTAQPKKVIESDEKIVLQDAGKQKGTKQNAQDASFEMGFKDESKGKSPKIFLNFPGLQEEGIINPMGERTAIAEEFRLIKRPILLKAFEAKKDLISTKNKDKFNNLILVTSSVEDEGKSFTAINLAMSMASEKDIHVLFIDCDMHTNYGHKSSMDMLGVENQKGLLDVLANPEIDIADVLVKTNIPNLTLCAIGQHRDEATELLASKKMSEQICDIAKRYPDRMIILDTPPVLATSETAVLALYVGQIIYVVEAQKTSRKLIQEGLRRLSFCNNISIVFNKAQKTVSDVLMSSYHRYATKKNTYSTYSYEPKNVQ